MEKEVGEKKKSCSVLGRPPRKSGTNSEIRIQYRIILLPFPVFVTRLWVSHSSAITRTKKPNEKEKESFTKLVSFPGPPRGKKKVLALFDTGKIAALRIYGCYSVSA